MSNESPGHKPSTTDQILDLLLDALLERQQTRKAPAQVQPAPRLPPSQPQPTPAEGRPAADERRPAERRPAQPEAVPITPIPPARPEPPKTEQQRPPARPGPAREAPLPQPEPGEEGWQPPPRLPSMHMGKMLGRLAILVAALIVLVNIPVTRYGVSLARIMPDSASLIIRDGLVLKGSGPEIYILEEGKLRWISSLDAFEHLRLTWEDVRVVEDEFLAKFEKGRPFHVLLKCRTSPHIYRLENQQKRWIQDIDTFLAEGHVWEDVRFVTCDYLRGIPDGPPIPEDAGPPPEP